MRWWDAITDSMDMNLSKLQKIVKDRKAWYASVHWDTTEQLNNNNIYFYILLYIKEYKIMHSIWLPY